MTEGTERVLECTFEGKLGARSHEVSKPRCWSRSQLRSGGQTFRLDLKGQTLLWSGLLRPGGRTECRRGSQWMFVCRSRSCKNGLAYIIIIVMTVWVGDGVRRVEYEVLGAVESRHLDELNERPRLDAAK